MTLSKFVVPILPVLCASFGMFLFIPSGSVTFSLLVALPLAFAVVWIANFNQLDHSQSALFGAVVALKLSIIKIFAPWLIGTPDLFTSGMEQIAWPSLLLLAFLAWIHFGCRSLSVVRILGLCGLSLATCLMAIYVGQDPWDHTGNVRYLGTWGLVGRLEALTYFREYELEKTVQPLFVGALLGFVGGYGLKNKETTSEFRPLVQVRLASLLVGKPISLMAAGFGFLFCCLLIGAMSADNSNVTTNRGITHFFPHVGDVEQDDYGIVTYYSVVYYVLAQFDGLALRYALDGVVRAIPIISGGSLLVWWLGRFRLTGLVPVLAVGSLGGLAWHMLYPSHGYWTPFMSVAQSATLIGMIAAAGFGAVAQIVDYKRWKSIYNRRLIV